MLLFVTAVSVVLVVSFLCSIFESVLLSLTRPQIEVMVRDDRRVGRLLAGFKDNMDVPIAAILILNTAAHTIGAAVAGASYSSVFNVSTLWLFSISFHHCRSAVHRDHSQNTGRFARDCTCALPWRTASAGLLCCCDRLSWSAKKYRGLCAATSNCRSLRPKRFVCWLRSGAARAPLATRRPGWSSERRSYAICTRTT